MGELHAASLDGRAVKPRDEVGLNRSSGGGVVFAHVIATGLATIQRLCASAPGMAQSAAVPIRSVQRAWRSGCLEIRENP
jgi:hypothetical protein